MAHRSKRFWLTAAVFITAVFTLLTFTTKSHHAAETRNRLASNRLASNRLAVNKLAANRLASNALTSTRLEANMATADLVATADGREVFSYLISCALPSGTTIQATIPNAPDSSPPDTNYTCSNGTCVFEGSIGLAEYWSDHRLDPKGQHWVSACVFARVNAHATAEPISLRGPHDSLTDPEPLANRRKRKPRSQDVAVVAGGKVN